MHPLLLIPARGPMWVVTHHSPFLYSDRSPTLSPTFLMARLISSQTLSRIIPQHSQTQFILHTATCLWRWNRAFETSAHKIQTPGNNAEESIQHYAACPIIALHLY
jgi:hypothetical protein